MSCCYNLLQLIVELCVGVVQVCLVHSGGKSAINYFFIFVKEVYLYFVLLCTCTTVGLNYLCCFLTTSVKTSKLECMYSSVSWLLHKSLKWLAYHYLVMILTIWSINYVLRKLRSKARIIIIPRLHASWSFTFHK